MGTELETAHQEDVATVGTFVNDERTRKAYNDSAEMLDRIYAKKWFTVDMIAKDTSMKDKEQVRSMMTGMQLLNLVVAKEGGKLYKHQLKFQLTLTPQSRLKVLEEEKEKVQTQMNLIDKEIEKVIQEIEESSRR